ncbi:MAG: branched-chain amino acid ABC transporter permease, partial [Chloroflexota bacterium]
MNSRRQTMGTLLHRLSTPVILVLGLLAIAILAVIRHDVVFERVVTVMLINLVLTVGLQVFMGNSGLGSFGQYAFVTVGAYA